MSLFIKKTDVSPESKEIQCLFPFALLLFLARVFVANPFSCDCVDTKFQLHKDDSDSDESVRVVIIDEESDEETDNMQAGTCSHNDLALYRSLLSESQQESDTDILPKRIRSFKALCKYILEVGTFPFLF